jgi:hypothetical protein
VRQDGEDEGKKGGREEEWERRRRGEEGTAKMPHKLKAIKWETVKEKERERKKRCGEGNQQEIWTRVGLKESQLQVRGRAG